jgi:DHA1 family multidrug resistance protein-like MFS transporter
VTAPAAIARRNQIVTVAMVFAVFTGFAFVLPFLPLFVQELGVHEAGAAALWAGVLLGVSPLVSGLLAPLWGRFADRYGHKAVVTKALAAYVVILVLTASVTSVGQLLLLRVGGGLFGGIGPLGLAMATAQGQREDTGRAVGLIQAAQILAAAIGPLAGGLLADAIGIRRTFLLTAVMCAGALVLVQALYVERGPGEARAQTASTPLRAVTALPGVVALLAVLFLVNFIGRSFTPILPLHLRDLGLPASRTASATGLLISVYSLAAAGSATLLGRLSRTVSPRTLLLATLVGGAFAVAPMALVPSFGLMLGLALLLGLVSGGSLTLCYTIGGLMVPEQVRATAFGFFSGAALFGGAVSPSVAGLVAHASLRGIYWVDALIYLGLAAALARGAALLPRAASRPPATARARVAS